MTKAIYERIINLLDSEQRSYTVAEHADTRTSADSAAVRGESLSLGAKALLLKADGKLVLAVLRADRKLDSRAFQRLIGARKLRFATREELAEATGGLQPGSVPPIGRLFDLPLYVDTSITNGDRVAFNAGMTNRSVFMSTADYVAVARPTICDFSIF